MLPQWHVKKNPGHSAKSAGGRLHLNMHTPLTQWSRSGLTMPLSRHSVGPVRKWAHMQFIRENLVTVISAHWATVDWSWPKEWNKCAWPNLHFKKKNRRWGTNCRTFFPNPGKRGKSHHRHMSQKGSCCVTRSILSHALHAQGPACVSNGIPTLTVTRTIWRMIYQTLSHIRPGHGRHGAQRECYSDVKYPVHKELSTMTYQDFDTAGMMHNGLVTYRTLWCIEYETQTADPIGVGGDFHSFCLTQFRFEYSWLLPKLLFFTWLQPRITHKTSN